MTTTAGFACELCGERHVNGDPICTTVEPEQSSGYEIVSPQHGVWLVYDEETNVLKFQATTMADALAWIADNPHIAMSDAARAVHDLLTGIHRLRAVRAEAAVAARGLLEQNSSLTLKIAENLGNAVVSFLDTIDGKEGA